ncbi:MAG: TetR/AcrR family transcriptional regulator [Opitutae bacterium]|nr:TetR/AcrR family transcriptional regulator [Opitutae bacterium]
MGVAKEQKTRGRLLQVAMTLFAERGFEKTTLAAISEQAEANIAAVNYHFGNKQALYVAVLRVASEETNAAFLVVLVHEGVSPEQRLRHHIAALISQIFSRSDAGYLRRMLAKEFAEPTFAIDMIFSELISQNEAQMSNIVFSILGPRVPAQQVHLAMVSVVAQFQFYNFTRLIRKMGATPELCLPNPETIAEHIYQFSLAGLMGMLEANKQ